MIRPIYYDDAYCRKFSAVVEMRRDNRDGSCQIALDRTAFYPTSGGQPHDLGTIQGIPVTDVFEKDGRIFHTLQGPGPELSTSIQAEIDWTRRFDHMQQHTAQHVLSQAAVRKIGAETVSFHLGDQTSTIDLEWESLPQDELYAIEDTANAVIFENRPIRRHYLNARDVETLGLRRSPQRSGTLRIIEVEDFDFSACGGTHCSQTGAVGLIKILRWERVRQRARVEFVAGSRALKDYRKKNRLVWQLKKQLSVSTPQILDRVAQQFLLNRKLNRELTAHRQERLERLRGTLEKQQEDLGEYSLTVAEVEEFEPGYLASLARQITGQPRQVVILATRTPKSALVLACSAGVSSHMGDWMEHLKTLFSLKGGGSQSFAQAVEIQPDLLGDVVLEAVHLARRQKDTGKNA